MIHPRQHTRILSFLLGALLASATQASPVAPETLAKDWTFHGLGSSAAQNRMFYMEEAMGSKGVMVVSPETYEGDLTVRYEIMPMNAASVCVAILFASDPGASSALSLPENFDGSMGPWTSQIENYFFAFHNQAHDRTPFSVRFPGGQPIGQFDSNVLQAGKFSSVEISRKGNTLSLRVDGQLLFEGEDPQPLGAGRLAFRLRGIPQIPAACLIRKLHIEPSAPASH